VVSSAYLGVSGATGATFWDDRDGGGERYFMFHNAAVLSWWNSTLGHAMQLTYTGELRVGNTSDLYSAKIQTNGNIHAQGAITTEIYLQMATASTPAAATGFARMWFDGTNIKVILPGGTTRTLNWT
jgi:hypothetical protein